MPILLIGTLDTKGVEIAFVRDLLRSARLEALVIDAGVLQPPHFKPDVDAEEVYAAAGSSLKAIQQAADRGRAIEAAARGVTKIAVDLFNQEKVEGVLSLGGSAGTTIGTAAMRIAVWSAENHGQHARQWASAALCRGPRHYDDAFGRGHQWAESD